MERPLLLRLRSPICRINSKRFFVCLILLHCYMPLPLLIPFSSTYPLEAGTNNLCCWRPQGAAQEITRVCFLMCTFQVSCFVNLDCLRLEQFRNYLFHWRWCWGLSRAVIRESAKKLDKEIRNHLVEMIQSFPLTSFASISQ